MNAPVEPARMQRSLSFLTDSIRERAQRLAAERQHAAAAIEYQVLIDIDPSDVHAGLRLAHQLVEAGQHARASDEYLRLAGIYARFGSVSDLAAKLRLALEQHGWSSRLGQLGRDQAVRQLSSDRGGPEIEAIYVEALRHHRGLKPLGARSSGASARDERERAIERGA